MFELAKSLIHFYSNVYKFFSNLLTKWVAKNNQSKTNIPDQKERQIKNVVHPSTTAVIVTKMHKESSMKVSLVYRAYDAARSLIHQAFTMPETQRKDKKKEADIISSKHTHINPHRFYSRQLMKPLRYSTSIFPYMKFGG